MKTSSLTALPSLICMPHHPSACETSIPPPDHCLVLKELPEAEYSKICTLLCQNIRRQIMYCHKK